MDFTLEDPSEWPISELEEIDFRLRCPICKEFLQTAMLFPNCSHNFCSLCIRRSLQLEHVCPVCRESVQENQLKNNLTLDNIVQAFTSCRAKVLSMVKGQGQDQALELTPTSEVISEEISVTKLSQSKKNEKLDDFSDSSALSDSTDSKDPTVSCPVCNEKYKMSELNVHLDECVFMDDKTERTKRKASDRSIVTSPNEAVSRRLRPRNSLQPSKRELQKLPKLCYNIMSDKQLRKVLKELGIPSHGDKMAMQRRHTEYLNLYNANCDSINLKSTSTLLKELRNWEKIHGLRSPQSKSFKNVSQDELLAHAEKYSNEFDKLIQSATPKRKEVPAGDCTPTKRQCSRINVEDEETDLEDASNTMVEEVIKLTPRHADSRDTPGKTVENFDTGILATSPHLDHFEF